MNSIRPPSTQMLGAKYGESPPGSVPLQLGAVGLFTESLEYARSPVFSSSRGWICLKGTEQNYIILVPTRFDFECCLHCTEKPGLPQFLYQKIT